MSDSESIKAIQQRMQQVRHDLGDEVEELVESAKDMTDWRKYVKANPWICLATAAAIGYIAIPKRAPRFRLNEADIQALARHAGIDSAKPKKGGMRRALVSFVSTAVLRGVMGYLGQRMTQGNSTTMEDAKPF
jgi:hypothetical protein